MEFSTKAGTPEKQKAGCVVVGRVRAAALERCRSGAGSRGERASEDHPAPGRLRRQARQHAAAARRRLAWPPQRVLLLGLGKHADFGAQATARRGARGGARAGESGAEDAVVLRRRARRTRARCRLERDAVRCCCRRRQLSLRCAEEQDRQQSPPAPVRSWRTGKIRSQCRNRIESRQRARRGHEPRQGSGQSAEQHLHALLSGAHRARSGQAVQAALRGARSSRTWRSSAWARCCR